VLRRVVLAGFLTAAVTPAHAGQATCSNPGVPVGAAASSELLPGRLTLNLTTGLLPISSSEVLDDVGGPVRYDSHLILLETRLGVEYALTPYLAIGGALPYRVADVEVSYFDPTTGEQRDPTFEGIHARNETIHGVGDPSLHVHAALSRHGFAFHGRLGATLPLGETLHEDPFALGHIGQEHEHIQLGLGVVMPFVAAEVQRRVDAATLAAWTVAYISLYENSHGYKPGSRISGGVTASSGLGSKVLTFGAAAEVHAETAEKWNGVIPVDEGNAGRYDVMLGGSVAWRATSTLSIAATAVYPVYSHVEGNQLDYGLVTSLSIIGSFDVKPRASYRGADVSVLGPAGSAAPLATVPGKITVFDLWADWCAPCRELDEKLAALARRYPDKLAVRKLEVVDADSAAWKAYLEPGKFELPHVKVYGRDGALLFERTAPPAQLIEALEATLAR
jgi:thiol-disulfide isomerase/thioredoxin